MTHPKVKLGLLAVLAAFGLSVVRADYTVDQSMTLTGDLNWQYNGTITVPAGVTIDLAGHKLSVGVLAGSGEITDTSASSGGDPGELHIVVPAGCTYGNSSVVISGNLKLVKDGAGTYTPTVDYYYTYGDKTYTGGTVVAGGTFKAMNIYYPEEPGVTVEAGAVFDINSANQGGGNASISGWYTLNGGTMISKDFDIPDKWDDMIRNIRLTADSRFVADKTIGFRKKGDAETFLDLGGHTLEIEIASKKQFQIDNCTISNGTLKASGTGCLLFCRKDSHLTNVSLDLGAPLQLDRSNITVKDLTVRCAVTASQWFGDSYVSVSGVYTPISDYVCRFKLLDGATINLSERTAAYPMVASSDDVYTSSFAFEDNAVITIDLFGRVLSDGEQVISWTSQPNATFVLDAVSALTYDMVVGSSGISVKHKENYVKTAIWTGAGDKDDPTDPSNWSCTDVNGQSISGYPCVLTEITVQAPVTMNIPAGTKVCCTRIVTAGTANLAANCDWRGLVKPIIVGTLDLAGHQLRISALQGIGEITDTSSGEPGELHLDVPAGVTAQNTSIVVSGNLKLVKDGAGTYAPTVNYYTTYRDKTYTGGTVVAGGTFKAMNIYYPEEPGVTVEAGAVFDINSANQAGGNASISGWYTLNGGTMVDKGVDIPNNWADAMHNIRLTADSCLILEKDIGMRKSGGNAETFIDLGGHTLDFQIASGKNFNLANCTISSGTVKTGGGGGAFKFWISSSRLADVTLDVDSPLEIEADVTVKNLTMRYGGNQSWWGYTQYLSVSGVYTPISDHISRFKLLNGSTINLSERTTVFPIIASSSASNTKSFAFEDDATVTVDLHGHEYDATTPTQVMSWPEIPDRVKFVLDSQTRRKCYLKSLENGLFVLRHGGTVICIR